MSTNKDSSEHYDVAIIGSGLYGIQAARYYLEVHPEAKLVIFEADDVVGGVWSTKRVYPNFWTQTPVRMAEFSDRPMTHPPKEDQYWGFFQAGHVSTYLESYVDDHVYDERSIRDRILFKKVVSNIQETADGQWRISCSDNSVAKAQKLIDATGMTSQPYIPKISGEQNYQGIALHHKDFGQSTFLKDPAKQHVVVLGGAKSAADVAYSAAKAGKTVSWIIREDGNGPSAFFGVQPVSPRYENSNEGFYNRFLGAFLPNPFGSKGILDRILQGTWPGRWYVQRLWDTFETALRAINNYDREEGKEHGFNNLKPDTPIFWENDSTSVETQPDILSTIAQKVHVYRQNIERLTSDSVILSPRKSDPSNTKPISIQADVFVYCTGWEVASELFPATKAADLGLPSPLSELDPKIEAKWKTLEDSADPKILSRFPQLQHPPSYRKIEPTTTPFRLYKAIAPISDLTNHSIVFLGKMVVGNNFRTAEVQALWAVAYLDGRIKVDQSDAERDVATTVAWDRRRYLNKGQLGSWFYYDVVAYADMLLEQLGLTSHRRKGWFGNLMDPCFASDLQGLSGEYKARYAV